MVYMGGGMGHAWVLLGSGPRLTPSATLNLVSAAIEADQSGFQFYKSGVFTGPCGHSVDHGDGDTAIYTPHTGQ